MNDNYQRSAVNRTRYGEQLDHVISCRRDSCAMLESCCLAGNPDRRPEYGQPCPVEEAFVKAYVLSFRSTLAPALGLEDDAVESVAMRLAMLELRRERLSARMRSVDMLIEHDGSRPSEYRREVRIVNRYFTAIDNAIAQVVDAILGGK